MAKDTSFSWDVIKDRHFFFKRICTDFALNLVLQRGFNTVLDSLIRLSKLPIGNIWKSETNHLSL